MSQADALKIIEAFQGDKYSSICTKFKKSFTFVDKGSFGSVFCLGDGTVIKVYKSSDRAYQTFQSVAARVDCEHFPKFHHSAMDTHYNYVIMEKLTPYKMDEKAYGLGLLTLIDRIAIHIGANEEDLDIFQEQEIHIPQSLVRATHVVRLLTGLYHTDLRICNMARRNDTLVFLDPLANRYPIKKAA